MGTTRVLLVLIGTEIEMGVVPDAIDIRFVKYIYRIDWLAAHNLFLERIATEEHKGWMSFSD